MKKVNEEMAKLHLDELPPMILEKIIGKIKDSKDQSRLLSVNRQIANTSKEVYFRAVKWIVVSFRTSEHSFSLPNNPHKYMKYERKEITINGMPFSLLSVKEDSALWSKYLNYFTLETENVENISFIGNLGGGYGSIHAESIIEILFDNGLKNEWKLKFLEICLFSFKDVDVRVSAWIRAHDSTLKKLNLYCAIPHFNSFPCSGLPHCLNLTSLNIDNFKLTADMAQAFTSLPLLKKLSIRLDDREEGGSVEEAKSILSALRASVEKVLFESDDTAYFSELLINLEDTPLIFLTHFHWASLVLPGDAAVALRFFRTFPALVDLECVSFYLHDCFSLALQFFTMQETTPGKRSFRLRGLITRRSNRAISRILGDKFDTSYQWDIIRGQEYPDQEYVKEITITKEEYSFTLTHAYLV